MTDERSNDAYRVARQRVFGLFDEVASGARPGKCFELAEFDSDLVARVLYNWLDLHRNSTAEDDCYMIRRPSRRSVQRVILSLPRNLLDARVVAKQVLREHAAAVERRAMRDLRKRVDAVRYSDDPFWIDVGFRAPTVRFERIRALVEWCVPFWVWAYYDDRSVDYYASKSVVRWWHWSILRYNVAEFVNRIDRVIVRLDAERRNVLRHWPSTRYALEQRLDGAQRFRERFEAAYAEGRHSVAELAENLLARSSHHANAIAAALIESPPKWSLARAVKDVAEADL
ncbi:MAG: hypothetical protein NZM12_03595 [Steroidobacteraceae bacterium]|nr:hypothetical protein [Steroidobacteraceae bacterium]MDW8259562.1 hypothetical protein [Gammaproteobacteria bacterium]